MSKGTVVSINVAETGGAPITCVERVHAVPDKGLEGDRYFNRVGTFSPTFTPNRAITLIEVESLEALQRDCGIALEPRQSRRNLVTRGVALNHLVGREFKVGEVLLRGTKLCEPCSHLEGLTQQGVLRGLTHRGGLCAQILSEGMIAVGDSVDPQ
ncbi:MAG TPA: MOSC domain-containing protein [Terriglobia bacterium]|nr:MOSC domain-containing protein [Terriglobia bacterium]